jgi:hypothetical protein
LRPFQSVILLAATNSGRSPGKYSTSNMTPQKKLRIANVLMLVGTVPLLIGIYGMFSSFPYDLQRQSQVGNLFLMIGKLFFAYVFAVIVSGSSGVWSAGLAKRNPGTSVQASRIIKVFVCIVLIVPLALGVLLG